MSSDHRNNHDREELFVLRARRRHQGLIALELDNERVIAPGIEAVRKAGKDTCTIMANGRGFAMHRAFRARDLAAKGRSNALMAETDAENGNGSRKLADNIERNTGLMRRARQPPA